MARQRKLKADDVIAAIRQSHGIKKIAAQRLGITRTTLNKYIRDFPTVQEAYEEEREALVDSAEAQLLIKIQEGFWPAISYVLSTLGRSRGYVTKAELDMSGDVGITLEGVDAANYAPSATILSQDEVEVEIEEA